MRLFAMQWHAVFQESRSPDSLKEINLCDRCGSSAAGGETKVRAKIYNTYAAKNKI
jgi:hypothetical protein